MQVEVTIDSGLHHGHVSNIERPQPETYANLLSTFIESGRVDDSKFVHHEINFEPTESLQTMAKKFVLHYTLYGLALVVTLWVLGSWIRRRFKTARER